MSAEGPVPALLALACALLLWRPPGSVRRDRLRDLAGGVPPLRPPATGPPQRGPGATAAGGDPPGPYRRRASAAVAGASVFLLFGGGAAGAAAGTVAGVLTERLLRRAGTPADDGALDLPVACDLLAVCLAAGVPVGTAVTAVAGSVPGPLGDRLDRVGALYRLGAAPRQAWSEVPPAVVPLARVLVRAGESGSSVVPALQRLAGDLRTARRGAVEAAVRRAGVWVLAPLGACFLPAFLCLGVVPMVLGIAADDFG